MTRRRRRAAALVAVTVVLVSACGLRGGGREAREPSSAALPVDSGANLRHDGQDRSYLLHRPATAPAGSLPLVLMLHGGFGSAKQARSYGWDAEADREEFLVAYPDGLGRAWSVGGGCCGASGKEGVDDVAFLEAVVADVSRRTPVDPARVYATGMSNGALMSYRLACDSDVFAAVGPVAGTLLGDCLEPRQVSLLHIHGSADENVPLAGGTGSGVEKIDGPSVQSLVDRWEQVDECAPATTRTEGDVTTTTASCAGGRAVELVTIEGAGHQWPGRDATHAVSLPGADPPSTALDATATLWTFFAAHPRS